jgi:hypothetical protein
MALLLFVRIRSEAGLFQTIKKTRLGGGFAEEAPTA